MAYITTEQVKEIRTELKALLPSKQGFKISVTRRDYSCLEVVILEAPIELRKDLAKEYEQIFSWAIDKLILGLIVLYETMLQVKP